MTTVEYLLRSSLVSFFVLKVGPASSRMITGGPGSSPARGRQHHGENTHVGENSGHKKPRKPTQISVSRRHHGGRTSGRSTTERVALDNGNSTSRLPRQGRKNSARTSVEDRDQPVDHIRNGQAVLGFNGLEGESVCTNRLDHLGRHQLLRFRPQRQACNHGHPNKQPRGAQTDS